MNYFLANLFRDKHLWIILGLSAWAGLMLMDLLTFMLTPRAVFGMWTFKIAIGAALVGSVVYGIFLHRNEKRGRQLISLLPGFIEERRAWLEKQAAAAPEFQTLCHQCRHFDLERLGCLLDMRERKVRIKLNHDSRITHCLYWNLDDAHPVMQVTARLKFGKAADGGSSAGEPKAGA